MFRRTQAAAEQPQNITRSDEQGSVPQRPTPQNVDIETYRSIPNL
jgi:hypothetical protein